MSLSPSRGANIVESLILVWHHPTGRSPKRAQTLTKKGHTSVKLILPCPRTLLHRIIVRFVIGGAVLPIPFGMTALQPVCCHCTIPMFPLGRNLSVLYRAGKMATRDGNTAHQRNRGWEDRPDSSPTSIGDRYRFTHKGLQCYNFYDDACI